MLKIITIWDNNHEKIVVYSYQLQKLETIIHNTKLNEKHLHQNN